MRTPFKENIKKVRKNHAHSLIQPAPKPEATPAKCQMFFSKVNNIFKTTTWKQKHKKKDAEDI